MILAANLFWMYPTEESSRVDPYGFINIGSPLYLGTMNIYDSNSRHALALRGYNISGGLFSIWNPWHPYYETMDASTGLHTADDTTVYQWGVTIYGWPAP